EANRVWSRRTETPILWSLALENKKSKRAPLQPFTACRPKGTRPIRRPPVPPARKCESKYLLMGRGQGDFSSHDPSRFLGLSSNRRMGSDRILPLSNRVQAWLSSAFRPAARPGRFFLEISQRTFQALVPVDLGLPPQ